MEADLAVWVATGVALWGATFLVVRRQLPAKYSYDFCVRLVSTFHAVLVVALVSLSVQDWRCPLCPRNSPPSPVQAKILTVTLSHLIYDTVCCFFHPKIQWDSYAHHIVSILALWGALHYNTCGSELAAGLLITEVSSPFLHLREMLKDMHFKDTPLNMINDIVFALVFSVARMVGGPYITYALVTADNPFIVKAMAVGLMLVSAYWFYKIARMMYFKIRKWTTPATKKST